MPRQNRVTPDSQIIAVDARGMFMGNRGRLHDDHGQIRRSHQGRRWIICELEFRSRRRQIMQPGFYTELFFLDEATALSAGHRPCKECRRAAFTAYVTAVAAALGTTPLGATELDRLLHEERIRSPVSMPLEELPEGSFVRLVGGDRSFLVLADSLLEWSPQGYTSRVPRPRGEVHVITPATSLAALRGGYRPTLHPSAMLPA